MLKEAICAAAVASVGLCSSLAAQEPYPRASAAGKKIKAALGEIVELDIDELPLANLAELLKTTHQIEVQLDRRRLADEGVASDLRFSFHVRGISLNSALRLLLSEADLTHVVHDEVLLITTKTRAEDIVTARLYPVADLATLDGDLGPTRVRIGMGRDLYSSSDYQTLADLIFGLVAPTTWDPADRGPGPCDENTGLLSIPQTQEVHEEIEALLVSLRAVREVQRKAGRILRKNVAARPAADKDALELGAYQLFPGTRFPYLLDDAGQRDKTAKYASIIQELIDPEAWQKGGGRGTMAIAGSTLLVRQTPKVHREIGKFLSETTALSVTQLPRLAPAEPCADWPQEAEPRPKGATAAIERALRQSVKWNLKEKPLSEIADFLAQEFEIPVVLDHRALADAELSSGVPLSIEVAGVSLESALRQILSPMALAFEVRHEALFITSKVEAENLVSLKVYPVLDLAVQPVDAAASDSRVDYEALEELLLHNVAPTTWHAGAVMAYPNCGALVVRQRREVHQEIARLFAALRQAARK